MGLTGQFSNHVQPMTVEKPKASPKERSEATFPWARQDSNLMRDTQQDAQWTTRTANTDPFRGRYTS